MDGLTDEEVAEVERRREANLLRESRDPAVLLPAVRAALHLEAKLLRVVRTDSEPAAYRLETSDGTVRLGPAARWSTRPSDFRAAVLDAVGEMPPRLRGAEWDQLCGMVARAAVVEDLGAEATDAGLGESWLRGFLANRPPGESVDEALDTDYPFRHADAVHVVGEPLKRWLLVHHGERVSWARLGTVLRAAGAEPVRLDVLRDGARVQVRAWSVPPQLTQCAEA